jgi:flagellar biosynthesis protein FlhB
LWEDQVFRKELLISKLEVKEEVTDQALDPLISS